jgi:hypothetical protein
MGTAEITGQQLTIYSHIITYGNAADAALTALIREEIESMWNEPLGTAKIEGLNLPVRFRITASCQPAISDIDIYTNLDARNNYFRIEEFVHGNISFADGIGCNTGYLKLENLYKGSTTAAHEYGHTIGLHHPDDLDLRGKGVPGIMYPRGTLVDPQYQYDPAIPAGAKGGTLHPMHRRVTQQDIDNLCLHRLVYGNGQAVLGEFTSIWHPDHATVAAPDNEGQQLG